MRWIETVGSDDFELVAALQSGDIPAENLPDDGFILSLSPSVDTNWVRQESVARNMLAMELVIESKVPAEYHRVSAITRFCILQHLQLLVKHACYAATKDASRDLSAQIRCCRTAMAYSFKLLLVAAQLPDLYLTSWPGWKWSIISFPMRQTPTRHLNMCRNTPATRPQHSSGCPFYDGVTLLCPIHGPLPTATRCQSDHCPGRTCHRCFRPFRHRPGQMETRLRTATEDDLDAEGWRLVDGDGKTHTGKARSDVDMKKLVFERFYVFHCEEELEEVAGTGKEKRLILFSAIVMLSVPLAGALYISCFPLVAALIAATVRSPSLTPTDCSSRNPTAREAEGISRRRDRCRQSPAQSVPQEKSQAKRSCVKFTLPKFFTSKNYP